MTHIPERNASICTHITRLCTQAVFASIAEVRRQNNFRLELRKSIGKKKQPLSAFGVSTGACLLPVCCL